VVHSPKKATKSNRMRPRSPASDVSSHMKTTARPKEAHRILIHSPAKRSRSTVHSHLANLVSLTNVVLSVVLFVFRIQCWQGHQEEVDENALGNVEQQRFNDEYQSICSVRYSLKDKLWQYKVSFKYVSRWSGGSLDDERALKRSRWSQFDTRKNLSCTFELRLFWQVEA
jgi:hypothetical protein